MRLLYKGTKEIEVQQKEQRTFLGDGDGRAAKGGPEILLKHVVGADINQRLRQLCQESVFRVSAG